MTGILFKFRIFTLIFLTCALTVSMLSGSSQSGHAIGLANIVVSSVYWGSNPMNPSNAHRGDVNVQLSIVLANVGDDIARNVNVTLILGPPLTYPYYTGGVRYSGASVSKMAGDIGPAASFTVGFTVSVDSGAREGVYHYNLQLSYRTPRELEQADKTIIVDVPIWREELHIQNTLTAPTKIFPGSKQFQIRVGLVNSGNGVAKDLQLRMDLNAPFKASSSGSDKYYLGNLPAGQMSEVNFIVDADDGAKFGRYSVVLGIESDKTLISIGEVPIYLNEKVKFEVVSVTPTTFSSGDSGKVIRVDLKNTGSVKAESVRVQLRVGNFFSGTLTDFLGTMLSGETKVAYFTIDVDGKAQEGGYSFDLRIDWTQENSALDDTLKLAFNVQPPGPPVTLIVFGAVILAAVAVYMLRRRRMKATQASTAK